MFVTLESEVKRMVQSCENCKCLLQISQLFLFLKKMKAGLLHREGQKNGPLSILKRSKGFERRFIHKILWKVTTNLRTAPFLCQKNVKRLIFFRPMPY